MKNLKLGVLAFGLLGIVSMFLPNGRELPSDFKLLLEYDKLQLVLMLLVFGVPIAMGVIGLVHPPFEQWQAIASTAAFGLGVVKTRPWVLLQHADAIALAGWLTLVAVVGGGVASVLAIAKPERSA